MALASANSATSAVSSFAWTKSDRSVHLTVRSLWFNRPVNAYRSRRRGQSGRTLSNDASCVISCPWLPRLRLRAKRRGGRAAVLIEALCASLEAFDLPAEGAIEVVQVSGAAHSRLGGFTDQLKKPASVEAIACHRAAVVDSAHSPPPVGDPDQFLSLVGEHRCERSKGRLSNRVRRRRVS